MKKVLSIALCAMVLMMVAGCKKDNSTDGDAADKQPPKDHPAH